MSRTAGAGLYNVAIFMDPLLRCWQEQPAPEPAPAEGAPGDAPPPSGSMWSSMVPFILIFVIFYFLLLRPQRRQQRERQEMISNLKKDDHVLTSGGLFGIVVSLKDDRVVLRIDERNDIRVEVRRDAVAGLVKASGAENKPAQEQARK